MTDSARAASDGGENAAWIRAFIAIPLPEPLAAAAADLIERLRKGLNFTACRPAWASIESLHLTLLFLGKLPIPAIPEAEQHLREVAAQHAPLRLRLRELGVFPHWNDPRVLWIAVKDKTRQLDALQAELARRLAHLAYRPDNNAFHPHVTLARFNNLKGTGPARKIIASHARFTAGPEDATEITLFRSELLPQGARHSVLHAAPLSGSLPSAVPSTVDRPTAAEQTDAGP